jgi:hypothetical protein
MKIKSRIGLVMLVAAALLSKYHIRLAPGERNGKAIEQDLRDQLTTNPDNLVLVFEDRY